MFCDNCGKELSDDALFCDVCGHKIEDSNAETAFCCNCGAPLEDGAVFCPICGAGANAVNNAEDMPPAVKTQGSKSILPMVLIIVAVLVVGGIGYKLYSSSRNGTEDSAVMAQVTEAPAEPTAVPEEPTAEPTAEPSPIPEVTAVPIPAIDNSSSQAGYTYLFNSDTTLITYDYLNTLSQSEVRFILNEIYARNGYIFTTQKYIDYFEAQPWYVPRYTSIEQVESLFNSTEKANKEIIVQYEISMGYR